MHDILRERLLRKIESLPEEQVYQILDYIEFLESKYGADAADETSGLRRFAEAMEDKLRKTAMSPATIREAFQLISAADRALANVSTAGKKLMEELTPSADDRPSGRVPNKSAARAGRDEPRTGDDKSPSEEEILPADSLPVDDDGLEEASES
jgi:hypothetical protein